MKNTLFLILITLNLFANAQNSDCSMWTKTFGGDKMDIAYSIKMTNDNGFIVAGKSHSYGYASSDVLVIKMDSCGNVQWMNTYGDEYDQEIGLCITPTNSGDYLFVGYYIEGFKDQKNILIGKIDSQGNLQWLKRLQNDFWSYAYDIIENNEGDYIIAGSWAVYPGRSQGYIAKLNTYGTILWTKTYGSDMNDAFFSVQQATDGGYIVTGVYNFNNSKVWLLKTNSSGNMVWGNIYADGGGYSVKETNDGGFVVGGYSDNTNAYLLKTNNLGDTLWTKTIDYGNSSIFRDISLTSDSGYICTGYTEYYANERDVLLIKTNNTGDTLWSKTYGGVQDDIGYSVLQYTDGSYAIAGQLEIYKTDHYVSDYWVIKTDNSGNTEYFFCDFIGDTINGEYPLSVNFFDQSTIIPGNIVEWEWDFGDGNQSFEQNPSHLFEIPGKYTISLIVKDINNKMDTCIKTDYIDVEYYPPIADFYADTTLGTVPFTVNFFDQSSNGSVPITSHYWDFGDGFNSLETNPVHIYQNSGRFTVSLIVTDENDSTGILIKENYITIFETTIDSGDVSGIWTLNNSPYLVNGNINVPLGQELMIESGVKIVFNGHYKFSVFGRLIAQANQVDSIFIIPLYEDIGWEGIWFQNTSTNNQDSSLLKYCHIEGVRYPEFTWLDHSGGIVCDNSADIIIQNCLITNNYASCGGGGITLINNSDIIIRENTITNNKSGLWSWWAGGGISMRNSNAIVIENLISHNEAWLGGGIFCSHNSSATIKNNVISYNNGREWGGGIYILSADPIFERNLISHNSFEYSGGGITIGDASPTLINNTIANNYHNGEWFYSGGGIYCYSDVNLNIINTIVWDNYPYEICLGDELSGDDNFVDIDFSDVKDGQNNIQIFNNGYVNWGWSNITSYPLFIDTTDNDYHLQEQSPCIDAGHPDPSYNDPDGTRNDMGTFYFNQNLILDLKVFLEGPFNETEMLTYLNSGVYLPLTQAYNTSPWNYTGAESVPYIPNSDIVDWILIELRKSLNGPDSATSATTVAQQAAFLLKNGSVVGMDGTSLIDFYVEQCDSLYVVIWHRNHLAVMSSNPLQITGGVYSYNFTTGAGQVFGGASGHKEIATDVWGMVAGDGNADGQIDEPDIDDVWTLQAGNSGFLSGDFTMESQVNNIDKNDIWLINNGASTQTPDNKNGEDYQLTWCFANPTVIQGSPNLFQFDIEIKCDELGSYHTQTQIYFDYDTLAFGSNIDGITQNPDINERINYSFLELMDTTKYLIPNDANNTSDRYAIITQPIDENYPIALNNLTEIDTSYKGFLRFQIEIQDTNRLAGIFFSGLLMDGGQYYFDIDSDTLPEKYFDPCLFANDMINEPLGDTTEVQEYNLGIGYQFISSRIIPEDPDMLILCTDILDNLDFVRNSSGQILRKIGPNWVNNIGDWIIDEGYLFKMYADDSFSIEGIAVDPSTPIPLSSGFQFVSYLPVNQMDALIAFATILNDDLDFIRNSSGGTLRKIGPIWVNGIGDCIPGEGYLVKMINPDILIYPIDGEKFTGIANIETEYFEFDGGNAADPVYTIYFEGLEMGDEVATYDSENLLGAMKVNSENAFDNDLPIFSTINDGQGYTPGKPIILKVWDNKIKQEVPVSYEFKDPYGTAHTENYFPANDGEYSILNITKNIEDDNNISNISIYPNPSEGIFNISINGISGGLQCRVMDLRGNDFWNFEFTGIKGFTVKQLDLKELPAGVYFICFTGRNFSQVKKIVIQ